MLERDYQKGLIKRIKNLMPEGTRIIKNDAKLKQGIQDLLVSYGNRCAWLEVKKSKNAKHQPNQDYQIWCCEKKKIRLELKLEKSYEK